MNAKKILVLSLAAVSSLTIMGIGFSSWYFGNTDIESKTNVSIHVYDEVTKGNISIEQSPSMISFSNGIGKKEDLTDGLEFYRKGTNSSYIKDDKIVLKYTIEDEKDSIDGNDFRLFVNVSSGTGALNDVIDITSTYENATKESGYDFSKNVKKVNGDGSDLGYFEYTLALNDVIQYKSADVKPLTSEAYQSLCSAISGSGAITIKFVVK